MGMVNMQVPPVGMRVPITPNAKAPSSVPRKKSKDGSRVEQTMNAQDEIKELKQRIAELEEQVERGQEFLQEGDFYWLIEYETEVSRSVWLDDDYDNKLLSVGNVFRTEEGAEFAVEKLKVEAELQKFSKPFEEGENNHFMVLDTYYESIGTWCLLYSKVQGAIYFESEQKAKQAIDTVGEDRIKKYIFGVED